MAIPEAASLETFFHSCTCSWSCFSGSPSHYFTHPSDRPDPGLCTVFVLILDSSSLPSYSKHFPPHPSCAHYQDCLLQQLAFDIRELLLTLVKKTGLKHLLALPNLVSSHVICLLASHKSTVSNHIHNLLPLTAQRNGAHRLHLQFQGSPLPNQHRQENPAYCQGRNTEAVSASSTAFCYSTRTECDGGPY